MYSTELALNSLWMLQSTTSYSYQPPKVAECPVGKSLLKVSLLFAGAILKFALLLFTTCPAILNTPLAALVAIAQDAFLAIPLVTRHSNQCSRQHWRMLPVATPFLPQALCSTVTSTCTGSSVSYPHKKCLNQLPARPAPAAHPHAF